MLKMRTSQKSVRGTLELIGWELRSVESLGDRKSSYYIHQVMDENWNVLFESELLKNVQEFIYNTKRYKRIVWGD